MAKRKVVQQGLIALVMGAFSFVACDHLPTPPDTTTTKPPVVQQVTVSMASLTADEQVLLKTATMSANLIQRMADRTTPVRVFVGPYSVPVVDKGLRFLEGRFPFKFVSVTELPAEIDLARDLPEPSAGLEACGSNRLEANLPVIMGGHIRIADNSDVKAGCAFSGDLLSTIIAHEITHILALNGHTPDSYGDYMAGRFTSAANILHSSSVLDHVLTFIHSAQPGAKVVQ